uniref:Uncharacterized protein LOC116957240 isoform X6 n=1 Tax=Petromyzon marinus TaxID=7757 RepID=A0AAJ7UF81_PETMA|nr:uncharacterized protein LOC116957240 isoform X6 [Petromyzon marinus]
MVVFCSPLVTSCLRLQPRDVTRFQEAADPLACTHWDPRRIRRKTLAAVKPLPTIHELDNVRALKELGIAINSLASGKSPGKDGITPEIVGAEQAWHWLKKRLKDVEVVGPADDWYRECQDWPQWRRPVS